jgi:aspartate kinase
VQARSLRGGEAGLRAEGGFCGAAIDRVDPAPLRALLASGVVPVVSGFQAVRGDGETVTLGRGASDLSAVAFAAALGAECRIVTDVEGVCALDPRQHPGVRPFGRLTHDALLRLAEAGARVVQREAAALAGRERVRLRVHHFRAPFGAEVGTLVDTRPQPPVLVPPTAHSREEPAACSLAQIPRRVHVEVVR